MNDKQKEQSEIAEAIKMINFERNRPTLTVHQLQKLKESLQSALKDLQSRD